jgi:hypothetical protein
MARVDDAVSKHRAVRPIDAFAVGVAGVRIETHTSLTVSGVTVLIGLTGLFGLTRPIGALVSDHTLVIDPAGVGVCALARTGIAHAELAGLPTARIFAAGRPEDPE